MLESKVPRSLASSSRIVEALPRAFATSAVKLRVFISPALRERLRIENIADDLLRRELTEFLYQA